MTTQFCRILVFTTLTLTGLSVAHGQSLSDRISSAVQGSVQNQLNGAVQGVGQQVQQQWTGGNLIPPVNIQWPPEFTNPGVIWPPQPQPCYQYIVYYYDANYGWRHFATYHSQWLAKQSVSMLQQRGYRAYMQSKQINNGQ